MDERVINFWGDGTIIFQVTDATAETPRSVGAHTVNLRPKRIREWLDISYPAHEFERAKQHFQDAKIYVLREGPVVDMDADKRIEWVRPRADGDLVIHAGLRLDVPLNRSHNDTRDRVVRLERVGGELSLVGIAHSIQRVPDA